MSVMSGGVHYMYSSPNYKIRVSPQSTRREDGILTVPFNTDSLILNFVMKSISSQFHVVFNDMFTSVHYNHDMEPDTWHQLITSPNCCLQVVDDEDNPDLCDEWLTTVMSVCFRVICNGGMQYNIRGSVYIPNLKILHQFLRGRMRHK